MLFSPQKASWSRYWPTSSNHPDALALALGAFAPFIAFLDLKDRTLNSEVFAYLKEQQPRGGRFGPFGNTSGFFGFCLAPPKALKKTFDFYTFKGLLKKRSESCEWSFSAFLFELKINSLDWISSPGRSRETSEPTVHRSTLFFHVFFGSGILLYMNIQHDISGTCLRYPKMHWLKNTSNIAFESFDQGSTYNSLRQTSGINYIMGFGNLDPILLPHVPLIQVACSKYWRASPSLKRAPFFLGNVPTSNFDHLRKRQRD